MIPLWHEPEDHPALFEQFHAYCDRDVETEMAAAGKMVPLSDEELAVYHLNEKINDRGILVDLMSVNAAIALCEASKARLDHEMTLATGGYVTACSQVARLTEWVSQQGVPTEKLAKADLDLLLAADDLPARVRAALSLRQEAAKASVAKLEAMRERACADGRIRGSFMFAGAGTGRFSSVGVQFQNMPRPRKVFADAHLRETTLYNAIRTAEPAWINFLYGDTLGRPLHLVSDALRGFLVAAPGHDFVVADYSSIEGRVNAWLAGEQWVIDAYVANDEGRGPGLYELTAAGIYDVPVGEVTKDQRQVGKVACLAEGQLVLTPTALVPIECLTKYDRVWDGIQWVRHDGVVCNGVRDVWEYDGLVATEDHIVFTADGRALPFGYCAREQIPLAKTGLGREAVRMGDSHLAGGDTPGGPIALGDVPIPNGSVLRLRHRERNQPGQSSQRKDGRVPAMQPAPARAAVAGAPDERGEVEVRVARYSGIQELRRAGRPIFVRLADGGGDVGRRELGLAAGVVDRPHRQQRPLRAGEFAVGHAGGSGAEPTALENQGSAELGEPVLTRHNCAASTRRGIRRRDHGVGHVGGGRAPEKLARYRGKARVYDVLNAGPRNRLTVSGVLVHNCLALGYQGGVSAFLAMARGYGIRLDGAYPALAASASAGALDRAEARYEECLARQEPATLDLTREGWMAAELTKVGWRGKHSAIVASWGLLEQGAVEAVANPGAVVEVLLVRFLCASGFLWMQLPSGRCLAYGAPRFGEVEVPWADKTKPPAERERRRAVTVCGVDSQTKRWIRYPLYGGILCENAVQAIARDILVNGLFKAEAAGYPVVAHIHDEVVSEMPEGRGSVEEFAARLCDLPPWCAGLPLRAAGWRGKRYRKD